MVTCGYSRSALGTVPQQLKWEGEDYIVLCPSLAANSTVKDNTRSRDSPATTLMLV